MALLVGYIPVHSGNDLLEQQVGRTIYKEFSTVVILKEQMRVADEGWKEMLSRLRYGRVTAEDIAMLRRLVIGHPECPTTDVNDGEWKKAALVTPRHGVRRAWNDAALRKHCQETGQRLYVCWATDTIKGRDLTLAEEYGLALCNSQRTATGRKWKVKNDLEETVSCKLDVPVEPLSQ